MEDALKDQIMSVCTKMGVVDPNILISYMSHIPESTMRTIIDHLIQTKLLYRHGSGLLTTVKSLRRDIRLYHSRSDAFRVMAVSKYENVFWFEVDSIYRPLDLVYCTNEGDNYYVCALTDPMWSSKAGLIKMARENTLMPGVEDDRLFVAVVRDTDQIYKLHTLKTFDIYAVIQPDGSLLFETAE